MAIVDYQQGELFDYAPNSHINLEDCFFDYDEVCKMIVTAQLQTKFTGHVGDVDSFIKDYAYTYHNDPPM